MGSSDVTLGLAFLAGIISFVSPCVLPLVPAYIGYMGGRMAHQVTPGATAGRTMRQRFGTFTHGVFFVLGFTIFFVVFGLLTTAAVSSLESFGASEADVRDGIARIGGTAVILFGLHIMGLLPRLFDWLLKRAARLDQNPYANLISTAIVLALIGASYWLFVESWFLTFVMFLLFTQLFRDAFKADSSGEFWTRVIQRIQLFLYVDTRRQSQPNSRYGYLGSLGMGVVFSAGWTPCIGPIYAAVLTLAAEGGSVPEAGTLLTAYSLGLGIPFLLTALALDQAQGVLRGLQRNMRTIEAVSGVFLILIGVLVFTGQLQALTQVGDTGQISLNMENCVVGAIEGKVRWGNVWSCIDDGIKDDFYVTYTKTASAADVPASNPINAPSLDAGAGGLDVPDLGAAPADSSLDVPDLGAAPDNTSLDVPDLTSGAPSLDAAPDVAPVGLAVGNRAPDFSASLLDGSPVSLSDYRGKFVLVNFWQTWCDPCEEEMGDFESIYNSLDQDRFVILAVNDRRSERSDSVVADFVDEHRLTFPIVIDRSGEINGELYRVQGYPTSYLLDADGIIVKVFNGIVNSTQLLDALEAAAS